MTITQLEYFLAVANHGSFSAAAESCCVTQPSLSMQISHLEEELGVILLDRNCKPVAPTEAGIVVMEQGRETIASFHNIKERVNDLKGEISGTLRLGVLPTISPYLLHRFMPGFVQQYPKVKLEICEMIKPNVIDALNRDMLDAAIVAGETPREIREIELFKDRFYAYVSPNSDFYERTNVLIKDIDLKQLLVLSNGHQALELYRAKKKIKSEYNFESGTLETLMHIVDNTSAITIIPQMAISTISEEKQKQVKMLANGTLSRKITLAVRRTYVKESIIKTLKEAVMAVMKR